MMRRPLTSIELQADDVDDMKSAFKDLMDKLTQSKNTSSDKSSGTLSTGSNQPGPSGLQNRCSSGLSVPDPGEEMDESASS